MDSLSVQLYAFAVTLIAGASIGLIFDLYRVIRSRLQPGAITAAVMDLIFWLVAAPVLIVYLWWRTGVNCASMSDRDSIRRGLLLSAVQQNSDSAFCRSD